MPRTIKAALTLRTIFVWRSIFLGTSIWSRYWALNSFLRDRQIRLAVRSERLYTTLNPSPPRMIRGQITA